MSDENCYILTRKMVQFVLIAWEAIIVGVTGGKVGAVASNQKCFGKMIFSMKLRDKCCGHVVNIITGDHI